MSAAQPAPPPGPFNGARPAAVIELDPKRRRRRPPGPLAADDLSPQQQLAETLEACFQRDGQRTLTDEETAAVYLRTLHVFSDLVDGALAQSLLGEEQHRHLRSLLDGMKEAPGLLS